MSYRCGDIVLHAGKRYTLVKMPSNPSAQEARSYFIILNKLRNSYLKVPAYSVKPSRPTIGDTVRIVNSYAIGEVLWTYRARFSLHVKDIIKEYRAESIRVIDTEYNYMPIGEGYSIALDSCKISKDHNSPEPASPPLGGVVLNRNIKHQDLPVKREPYHIMKDGQVIINPEY